MVVRTSAARVRRFTRSEYERMAAQGILGPDERVELVEGEIPTPNPNPTWPSSWVLSTTT